MNKRKNKMRVLSAVLVSAIVLNLMPYSAYAQDLGNDDVDPNWNQEATDETFTPTGDETGDEDVLDDVEQSTPDTVEKAKAPARANVPSVMAVEGLYNYTIKYNDNGIITSVDEIKAYLNENLNGGNEPIGGWYFKENTGAFAKRSSVDDLVKTLEASRPNAITLYFGDYSGLGFNYKNGEVTFSFEVYENEGEQEFDVSTIATNGTVKINGNPVSGTYKYNENDSLSFEITPNSEYYVSEVKLGESALNVNYTNGVASFTVNGSDLKDAALTATYNSIFKVGENTTISGVTYVEGTISESKADLENEIINQIISEGLELEKLTVTVEYNASSISLTPWKAIDYIPGKFEITNHSFGAKSPETVRVTVESEDGKIGSTTIQISVPVTVTEKPQEPEKVASSIVLKDDIVLSKNNAATQIAEVIAAIDTIESKLPEGFEENITVRYWYAGGILGIGADWKLVEENNVIPEGTQKIKIEYAGNDEFEGCEVEATVQVGTDSSIVLLDTISVTYGSAEEQKMQILAAIDWDNSDLPEEFDPSDYTVEYKQSSLGGLVTKWIPLEGDAKMPVGEQTIRVTFNGNDTYNKSASAEATINVEKANTSLVVNSQVVQWGEEIGELVTTADDAYPLTIIVGSDISLTPYVSVKFDAEGFEPTDDAATNLAIRTAIQGLMASEQIDLGAFLDGLSKVLELAGKAGVDLGFDADVINSIIGMLPDGAGDLVIRFNQDPTDAGAYVVVGVSLSKNYNTAVGAGLLTILPNVTDYKLQWNQELPDEIEVGDITNGALADFDWDASLVTRARSAQTQIKYVFSGLTTEGIQISQESPVDKAGVYVQTAYVKLGGNQWAPAIARTYTIKGYETCQTNKLTAYYETEYDGTAKVPNTAIKLKDSKGNRFTPEANQLVLVYTNTRTGEISLKAPTDAGHYIFMGTYIGDDLHAGCAVMGSMRIIPRNVTIQINDQKKRVGDADPDFTYSVVKGEVVEGDDLGITLSREAGEDVGTYRIYASSKGCSKNYNVKVQCGKLEIIPRETTIIYVDNETGATVNSVPYTLTKGDLTIGQSVYETGVPMYYYLVTEGDITLDKTTDCFTVYVVRNKVPVIEASDVTIKQGDEFDPLAGVTATDSEDGDLTSKIEIIENTVDVNVPGEYTVTYKVTDSMGETSQLTITVTVLMKAVVLNQVPVISANDVVLTVGDKYDPLKDVTATDYEDGDLTDKVVVVENPVDTSKAGVYTVKLSVTDSQGATVVKYVKVEVKAKDVPTDNNTGTNNNNSADKKTEKNGAVKTGDTANIALYIGLAIAAALALMISLILKRRKRY